MASSDRLFRTEPVILLVEDQRFFQQVFRAALGALRPVLIANNAMEGWRLYLENAPDIAFLDVEMEGASGQELALALNRFDPHGFLVMLSAAYDIENMAEAYENGVRDYITKPYNKQKLNDCLSKFRREHMLATTHEMPHKTSF